MMEEYTDLNTPARILLGPGPSMVHPRVLRAMAHPMIGHLDPQFIALMNEVQELLRFVFQTSNQLTIPVSGTGSAGMEAALCNFIEPGDSALIGVNGYFGERLCDIAGRYGAEVQRLERPWGEVFAVEDVEKALQEKPAKLVALVHAETSTGALQPMEGIADVVHHYGGLLVVDCVTSLGGVPVTVDAWNADIVYSGTQKCLSCPPGLAPLTVSPRALELLRQRKTKVANWYLDLTMIAKYWGNERTYHHTAPISMNYALREALRLIQEEGLEQRFERHRANAALLWEGLQALGLELHVPPAHRLPTLTTVLVPQGLDEAAVRRRLLNEYNIEIAGGLGAFKGHVWRIGLMGYSSRRENVILLLSALERLLG
ncbi:MAG TPA: alanine--glyoxylate aminotransferase family protein [Anaerolineae bacterium]|nr:alanine--glyoxylate aminotransferase family protein [Anaerolineae bacterium]HIQ05886.1 alanine--glyoxylate aminotransferase family protein [Anaerolineae bacterium]